MGISHSRSNPASSHLYIVDTRPKINAMYNRAAGKGYEAEAFYPNTKFVFKAGLAKKNNVFFGLL